MAKIAFSKLDLKKLNKVETFKLNDEVIEVKQYLPINDKLNLVSNVLNALAASNSLSFKNPGQIEVLGIMEIVYAYTNISFTEKQKEDFTKVFDLLEENGVINKIIELIPSTEYDFIKNCIEETTDSFYKYRSSIVSALEMLPLDYEGLEKMSENIKENLTGLPEEVSLLKDITEKLG